MSTYPIDESFDVALANALARLESYNKHLYRPNSYLHKWWARRCGSTFRLVLKHLVADEARSAYYEPGGLEGKLVLDPMIGGGTTLHEAIRLGANVIGYDLDPVAVANSLATLTMTDLEPLQAAFDRHWASLSKALSPGFQTACELCGRPSAVRYTLYGLNRYCACGVAILVDSLEVSKAAGRGSGGRLCPRCHAIHPDGGAATCTRPAAGPPIYPRATRECPHCGQQFADDLSRPYYARYTPLVVVVECPEHGRRDQAVGVCDRAALAAADARRADLQFAADLAVRPGPKSAALRRQGVKSYADLFSSRQLHYVHEAARSLAEFDGQERLVLALLTSTSLEFNSLLCGYKGYGRRPAGAIRHVFAHHAYSFPYTALENNPVFPKAASGTLLNLFANRVARGRRWAARPRERLVGEARRFVSIEGERDGGRQAETVAEMAGDHRRFMLCQASAARLAVPDGAVDFVITDPPYFDSVQYGDLSAFFRAWLPALAPDEAAYGLRWQYDLGDSAVGTPEADGMPAHEGRYAALLTDIFRECNRVLNKDSGRLIFTYHHWRAPAWAALAIALHRAQFRLVNRYVVHSENPISVHIANLNALTDDALLVLAPAAAGVDRVWERPAALDGGDSAEFARDCGTMMGWLLQSELPEAGFERAWEEASAG